MYMITAPGNYYSSTYDYNIVKNTIKSLIEVTKIPKESIHLYEAEEILPLPYIPPEDPIVTGEYFPVSLSVTRGTIVSGDVSRLTRDANDFLVIKSQTLSGYNYSDWNVAFKVPGNKITPMEIFYYGHQSKSTYQSIFYFNYVTGRWDRRDQRNTTIGTDQQIVIPSPPNYNDYVSVNGNIVVRVYSYLSMYTFYTYADYFKIRLK